MNGPLAGVQPYYALYTHSELEQIAENLKKGKKRFGDLVFSGEPYKIQRNSSRKEFGLAYDPIKQEFLLNYPHMHNVLVSEFSGVVTEKFNGSNLAFVLTDEGVVWRTRGVIKPSGIYNQINEAISSGTLQVPGITTETFTAFLQKYMPVYTAGRTAGLINENGYVNLAPIIEALLPKITSLLTPPIVAVFGELIAGVNPIAVDNSLHYGIYLNLSTGFKYVIFDLLMRTDAGYAFIHPKTLTRIPEDSLVTVAKPLTSHTLLDALMHTGEEGLVLKSPDGYFKLKKADVLKFERLVATNLYDLLRLAVARTFEKGVASSVDILTGRFAASSSLEEVVDEVMSELETYGFNVEQLTRGFDVTAKHIHTVVLKNVRTELITLILPELTKSFKPGEVYLKTLEYISYPDAVIFNEKRKKLLPSDEYKRILNFAYGKSRVDRGGWPTASR